MAGLLEELDAMRTEERGETRDDGYDFYVSDHAYENAKQFIPIMERYPRPRLALPGESDVTFAFQPIGRAGDCVRVNFRGRPSERDYIYYQAGNDYNAIDMTPEALAERLNALFVVTVVPV